MPNTISKAYPRAKGISLIEILIAVFLVSIGFLAAAKMQTQGIRNGQGAYHQAQAHLMLSDMMDRMRSNPVAVRQGDYDNQWTNNARTDPECSASNSCSTSQQANQDLFDWSANLHPLRGTNDFIPLLAGSDTVEARAGIVPTANGAYEMSAFWVEKIGSKDNARSIVLEFIP